jgi:MFS transporter, NNP family, nitrate/nitrite transporter
VLLGSLMRIPLGWLTDRRGGRRMFTALLAYSPLPLVGLAIWHDSLAALLVFGFLLGFAGASFAVGVPFVNGWYPPERQGFALGIYGMGMGGIVLAGLTAPKIADAGLGVPFLVAAGLLAVTCAVFAVLARDAPRARQSGPSPGMFQALAIFRVSGRAWALTLFYFLAFGGFVAMFLYLPKLLTGVHDLGKEDAGARAAGFALLAVVGRPTGGWLSDRVGAARVLLVSFTAVGVLALILAAAYTAMVPLTIACLTMALALGLGTGAVFKLVPEWFPDSVGSVTGVVGAAGGPRRVLPAARHGHREVRHRRLRGRVRAHGPRRAGLPDRPARAGAAARGARGDRRRDARGSRTRRDLQTRSLTQAS